MRQISKLDKFLIQTDLFLTTIWGKPIGTTEPNPSDKIANETDNIELNEIEKKESVALMRVNHTGEVCAQALYQSQSLYSQTKKVREALLESSIEENNHLVWCSQRIAELGGRTSYLNPFFYGYSFTLGAIAGLFGDKYSLGFVAETEKQVENHLNQYLEKLPKKDKKSNLILTKMREDEISHGKKAQNHGGIDLPEVVKKIMKFSAKIMTKSTYYL